MKNLQTKGTNKITAVDLFCGAGGLTKGLEDTGIKVNLGVDIDPACEYPYNENNSGVFLNKSITDLLSSDVKKFFSKGSIRLLAGCAPCQTFSGLNRKKADNSDSRWWLLLEFKRLIQETQPELVTMENVPGLLNTDVFQTFKSALVELGYMLDYQIVNCAKYGLPQNRKRLVLLASKIDEIRLLTPKEFTTKTTKTVRDALSDLESISAGGIAPSDSLHKSANLTKLNLRRIRASKPGGNWKDWNESLILDCHKKESGSGFLGVYSRMEWNKPSPTITTQFLGFSRGRFGHPEQDRALSLREGAILQGFPKDYKFTPENEEPKTTIISKLIGNAVPVTLGQLIGKSIIEHVNNIE
ncbi:DNA cytosine methyltransferase [Bathymodiolus thermophilus thioautotrophic gill symbiont]|uniref:DNA (cytosine-5-)-methyltransferase n=2 Tax=Bathymodiolus thermophilus thioautotrophic gill symbiont TaxID=2360 RepID=A0A1J5U975_9GAMM|nr:DNA cytosine methyltransferase [Bathymodiolus thermophilus thioautotrophic gill symbiont]OIR25390.1 DNA (cytosine-5-)-methyltransferase [Bathymodiolus thermophilus thioautotrophic gill symbiont]